MQALAQVAELRQQQTLLRTHIQGEVALASSECTHQLESAQYTWRQKALLMEGQAQSESLTVAKLQAHSSQVWVPLLGFQGFRPNGEPQSKTLKVPTWPHHSQLW